ncbi:MAG TPA: methyltransferase domain-containing protein [Phycisphaerae bacterium]|nr:methyltransferase domain-containing protein [Phycisphaerae bacterium]
MQIAQHSDEQIRRWLRAYLDDPANADFLHYAGEMTAGISDRYLWMMRYLAGLGRMRRARVLDVGCGFGWHAVTLALLGGNRFVANDIRASMTDQVARRVAAIRAQGAPVDIETLTGDICSLDLPAESFDAVLIFEAIEHIHDLDKLFRVCHRLLRRGGRLVATNDNNALSPEVAGRIQAMWRRRDRDWEYINELKRERPIENADIEPYAVMRARAVRAVRPDLPPEDVGAIVDATAGLTSEEIAEIARAYTPQAALPAPPRWSWCRNPETGEYCERLLDPFALADLLRKRGFRPQVRHGFRKPPLSLLNHTGLRWLDAQLFRMRSFFVLVAEKRQD